MTQTALVEMRKITKHFPGVVANDGINFSANACEIHALLGENGAGKSTLMNILTGLHRPDEGEIIIKGKKVAFRSPKDAIKAGIGMVHQHFRLVEPFTVAENVILGQPSSTVLRMEKVEKEIEEISRRFALWVEPKARIWQLSVGEQQRVEIIKMLYRGSHILILDEPTAVLTPQEVRDLFATLRRMADQGCGVIFITHKLHEVMAFADRITVLREGKSVATLDKKATSREELARLMVGRDFSRERMERRKIAGPAVLKIKGLKANNDKGRLALDDFYLEVRAGEILGIAGVAGNGQRELAEVITGLRPALAGHVYLEGKEITNLSPKEIIDRGVSHVPEDRLGMGLIPNLGSVENISLKSYRWPENGKYLLNLHSLQSRAAKLIEEFNVKTSSLTAPVKMMSGGNLQKLLLAREISAKPKLIVAVYPVRGLDVGATETVHELLMTQREQGTAILMISEDLEEIFKVADRVAVLFEGKLMGILPVEEAELEEIGLMMAGVKRAGEQAS
ncbi:MAG: ABC transporter ATP-binding protein [Bacillota bacterium]